MLEHDTGPGFPESPKRLTTIRERLQKTGTLKQLVEIEPALASEKWIKTVHGERYISRVKRQCKGGARFLGSPDVPISTNSYKAALMAVGAGLAAVDAVMTGKVDNAFCAVRPPGHHARPGKAMGFCIFNNIAIAARYVQQKYKLKKVLIIDWDVHHGNSTQEVFFEDPTVLHIGLHRHPFYPGTGTVDKIGKGKGQGFNINVPLPAGSGIKEYRAAFEKRLMLRINQFKPDFVLISAGFDAHENDPLGGMKLTSKDYGTLTGIVKDIAQRHCKGRVVSFLEGGYNLEALAESVEEHVKELAKEE